MSSLVEVGRYIPTMTLDNSKGLLQLQSKL